ncbi:nucleoside 2-deoxyribosyltransferase [bacterium]|nr:MAG: nucleoside 2-deoxyribosyltransferase [bacterium]
MKIYFAGSIRGGRDDKELYSQIIQLLSHHGTVLTEHVGDKNLSAMGEDGLSDEQIFKRDMKWLKESDILVAEVTTPSLGVGYEIANAEATGKKVICLYRPAPDKKLSAMISGNKYILIREYNSTKELEKVLANFFK